MNNYLQLFESQINGLKQTGENQFIGLCCFHDDNNPSLAVNIVDGLFNCFSCGVKGNSSQFAEMIGLDPKPYSNAKLTISNKQPYPISNNKRNGHTSEIRELFLSDNDRKRAFAYHSYLLENFDELTKDLPWTIEAVEKTFTGYDKDTERFTFLHTDSNGKALNIKWHKSKDSVPYSVKGHGKCRLYPMSFLHDYKTDLPLIICEGEKDVLTCLSLGLNAITSTTGADCYPKDLTPLKPFQTIYILYDNDEAGRKGSLKLAKALKQQSPQNKIILSSWESKIEKWDLTDHFKQDKDDSNLLDEFNETLKDGRKYTLVKEIKLKKEIEGIWIPREIWLMENLTLMEKHFLVEIKALDNEHGCFASNGHFADFFGISKGRCTQIIKNLETKKVISIDLKRQGKLITKRTLRIISK